MGEISEHRLENGLRVLIKPMRAAPVVSVWIWYRVGSRFERPGITGISHWTEHMLFQGTPTFPKGEVFRSLARVGGVLNGFTREDDTVYFETVPKEHLDLALHIEADRMVNCEFDPGEVARERTVVIAEREGAENRPEYRLAEEVQGVAFQVHPYRWPVIGYKCDLEKITRDDLFAHYREFYVPDNATLVLVGDLELDDALARVRQRFGSIPPSGRRHEVRSVEPEQCGERRVEVRRPGGAIYWECVWHIPAYGHPDRIPLMVLEAVLSGARPLTWSGGGHFEKSARLHEVLVSRKKFAVSASAYARLLKDPGLFSIGCMLRDGVHPEKLEAAVFAEIGKLCDGGPRPEELVRARRQVQAQVEYARDGIAANAYLIGDLDAHGDLGALETLVDRVAVVSAADVVRVARTYLTARNRTVGIFIPESGAATAGTAAQPITAALGGGWCSHCGLIQADTSTLVSPRLPQVRERRLDCGIRVLGVENLESHSVVLAGFLRGGAALEPPGKEGLAFLTARMLDQGTRRKTRRQIALATDRVGATISFGVSTEAVNLGGRCLPRDLGPILRLLRECLAEMTAPAEELEKVRAQALTAMKADRNSTAWMAMHAALEALYSLAHPYGRDLRGTPETLLRLTREDILKFATCNFGPENLTMILVGPISFDRMCRAVEEAFVSWQLLGTTPALVPQTVARPAAPEEKVIAMPGKSQCDLVVARRAIPRLHPDYHALAVAVSILGQFALMGRIGRRVRDQMGLAYYASASLDARTQAGHWCIRAGVNPANVRRALAAIAEETERFCCEPVSADELEDSRGNLLGMLPLRLETNDSLASLVREIAFYDLPLDYLGRYCAEVRAVTPERVLTVARQWLMGSEPVVAIAGPPPPE